MGQRDHAVVVGISRYPHLKDLQGPEHDVEAIVRWLRAPDGGDVPERQIHHVTSARFAEPARPWDDDVYEAFDPLRKLGASVDTGPAGDRLYIFMAGHGFAPELRDTALLMANADASTLSRNVVGTRVADYFGEARYFKEIVLVMDCCRENREKAPASLPPWKPVVGSGRRPRRLYAYAAGHSEVARERLHEGQMRGMFTVAFLEALRAAASPSQFRELVRSRMVELMGEDNYREPEFDAPEPEVLIGRAVKPSRLTVTLLSVAGPLELGVYGGPLEDTPLGQATLLRGETAEFALPPTYYEIRISGRAEPVTLVLGVGDEHRDI